MTTSASVGKDASVLLKEAMQLLDPSCSSTASASNTNQNFSLDAVAKAHDLLLQAAATDTTTPTSATTQKIDVTVISDLYRAILLTCHLLLEMAPIVRQHHPQNNSYPNEGAGNNNNTKPYKRGVAAVVTYLDQIDVATLVQTSRRCICILQFISRCPLSISTSNNNDHSASTKNNKDWHDHHLPNSRYDLLTVCFHGENRLISLDLDVYTHYAITNDSSRNLSDSDDDDDGEEHVISLYHEGGLEEQLEREENMLLDIAFPVHHKNDTRQYNLSPSRDPAFTSSIYDGVSSQPLAKVAEEEPGAAHDNSEDVIFLSDTQFLVHEGWLTLVKIHLNSSGSDHCSNNDYDKHNQQDGVNYFCKLFHNGMFVLMATSHTTTMTHYRDIITHLQQQQAQKATSSYDINMTELNTTTSSSLLLFKISEHSACQPFMCGRTFHFRLDNLYPHHRLHSEEIINAATTDSLLLCSDGGLTDGFRWVTAITSLVKTAPAQEKLQNQIRFEWEDHDDDDNDDNHYEKRCNSSMWSRVAALQLKQWNNCDNIYYFNGGVSNSTLIVDSTGYNTEEDSVIFDTVAVDQDDNISAKSGCNRNSRTMEPLIYEFSKLSGGGKV